MIKKIFIFTGLLMTVACVDKKEKEIATIPMDFPWVRLDSLFMKTPDAKMGELSAQYPYFFTQSVTPEEWCEIRKGSIFPDIPAFANLHYTDLYEEIEKNVGTLSAEKKEIKNLFQHIKYYFPKFEPPKVIMLISRVAYETRVIYADSLLLIGTDNYLGSNHKYYQDMDKYISTDLDKKNLVIDVADAFADELVPRGVHLTFLDNMIYEGKKLYLEGKLLPKKTPADLLHYDAQKYAWAKANEAEIWRYFIEKELLYQTDKKLMTRFLYPAPFSKFYLGLDNESPGQIGRFIGYRIVEACAEKHPDDGLLKLLTMPPEVLFKASNYKPSK